MTEPHLADLKLTPGTDKCRCTVCAHRAGDWKNDGANRRCRTAAEMTALGWLQEDGFWIQGKRPASAPTHHGIAGNRPKPLPEEGVPSALPGAAGAEAQRGS